MTLEERVRQLERRLDRLEAALRRLPVLRYWMSGE
jgi:exonuclease VII small subunit